MRPEIAICGSQSVLLRRYFVKHCSLFQRYVYRQTGSSNRRLLRDFLERTQLEVALILEARIPHRGILPWGFEYASVLGAGNYDGGQAEQFRTNCSQV
jgi:hypothetical protein